jgi:glycosyltransferase involved in cell wall biosynthesis
MATARGLKEGGEPLPILYILDNFPDPHAGTEGQFWLLFRNLDQQRFAATIMLLRPSRFLSEQVRAEQLKVLGVQSLLSPGGIFKLLRAAWWARRSGFAIAHIYFNDSAIAFPMLLKLLGIKVIVSRRDLGFWYTPRTLRLLRFVAGWVDRVVANCEAVRAMVIRAEGFAPERVDVIYNGIGRDSEGNGVATRAEFGIGDDARVIVVVANLRPLKRIGDALSMVASLQSRVGDCHLIVVGEDRDGKQGGSHRDELRARAGVLGVADKLHFAGKLANPMPVIALADLCVLFSESEGLSNTVIEYMLAGKPVICTDVGGNGELIVNDETGHLVPVGDVEAMTRCADSLLRDRARARQYGERGRARALSMFTAQTMVRKQSALYESLAGGVR